MTGAQPLLLLVILLGPAIGSFLAVLVDRLPRGEDTVLRASGCRSCGTALKGWQMVPILSFLIQRGRCKNCGAVIPPWLLYLELICLGLGILAVLQGGGATEVVLSAAFLWLLAALATADLIWFRLFDPLTAALALVAFAMALAPQGVGLEQAALGAALGAGSFAALRWGYWLLRRREGLGLGDVKLMVGLGAFSGPYDLPLLVLLAAVMALVVALGQRLVNRQSLAADRPLPFGAALCAAAAMLWLTGPQLAPMAW